MKRLLVAILAFSLCACNSSTGGSSATSTSDSSTETSAKYKAAVEKGLPILTEEQLYKMLQVENSENF